MAFDFELRKPGEQVRVRRSPPSDDEEDGAHDRPDCTYDDQRDMRRLGKKQELRRNFRFISILGFVLIAMGTWQVTLSATAAGLTNGGTGGMIWMFVGSYVCFGMTVLSLAEMSSMAPTAGGQYHWASEFAPRSCQQFISYIAGLISIKHPDYTAKPYQGYLFVILMVTLGLLINTWGAKHLPLVEGIVLVLHVFGLGTVLIVLWILSPKNSAEEVFTSFENSGGWSTTALSMLVGQVTSIYGLIGSDGASHMAEETKDASIIVPRCMLWSYILNGSMGFAMLITYCFCLTDVEGALHSASGFPLIYVFQTGKGSTGGAIGLTAIIIVLGLATYAISIGSLALKRLRGQPLPRSRWSLGRFGLPINCFALLYSCFAMIFVYFPVTVPVSADSMNYAIVMFTGVFIIAVIWYLVRGKHVYKGPVVYVRQVDDTQF